MRQKNNNDKKKKFRACLEWDKIWDLFLLATNCFYEILWECDMCLRNDVCGYFSVIFLHKLWSSLLLFLVISCLMNDVLVFWAIYCHVNWPLFFKIFFTISNKIDRYFSKKILRCQNWLLFFKYFLTVIFLINNWCKLSNYFWQIFCFSFLCAVVRENWLVYLSSEFHMNNLKWTTSKFHFTNTRATKSLN